jgi:predicted membrane-bound mannosyltransferase
MKSERKITAEIVLYLLIFLAALVLRMLQLGQSPLLESEARWAFDAWQLAQGEGIPVASQVGYLSVTEGLFSIFEAGNFLARIWPAFAGSLLIWLPFLIRKELDRIPALVLAGALALDPTLVPVSRISGSPMPALVFLVLAVGAFHVKKIPWALFFVGLGLFSGPSFWLGMLLLVVTILISKSLGLINLREYSQARMGYFKGKPELWLAESSPALLGLLIIGSFFIRNFQGITAWAGSLVEFINSWGGPVGLGLGKFLLYFLINNPLALFFGSLGFIYAWRTDDRLGKALSIWFVVSLLGLLIYPHRQAVDLIWLVLPLWFAAATELVRLYNLAPSTWVTQSLAGLAVVLASLNWLTFIGMIFQAANPRALLLELGLLAASLALLILAATIVSSEWGWSTAWKGLSVGAAVALLLYLGASLSLEAYIMDKDPRSIFSGGSGNGQVELLRDSIADVSITATGRPESIQGAVIGESDILRWALRDYEGIDFMASLASGTDYPLLITTGEGDFPAIQENYRGQDFVLSSGPGWGRILPDDWISWIGFRKGPIVKEYLILWVRNDYYSGY